MFDVSISTIGRSQGSDQQLFCCQVFISSFGYQVFVSSFGYQVFVSSFGTRIVVICLWHSS